MITPIKELKIQDIIDRRFDLLVSSDDIHELVKNEKNALIDEILHEIRTFHSQADCCEAIIKMKEGK